MPNGQLALLDPSFLQQYFASRVSRWYPRERLLRVSAHDQSHALYKKSILFTLTLRALRGPRQRTVDIRGNVPSLDTTREAMNAYAALTAIWQRAPALRETISRPLRYDRSLRVLLYESVPGIPLMVLLRHRRPNRMIWLAQAARWLAGLHESAVPAGQNRTVRDERREAGYFLMNYRGFFPSCAPQAKRALDVFFRFRSRLARFRRQRALIHGDFNPNNVIVDAKARHLSVIDFGNARFYDPMSDLANAIIQLGYVNIRPFSEVQALQKSFLAHYERAKPLTERDRAWLFLFRMWWSLQTLSFTMTLPMTTHANIQPVIARAFRETDAAIRFLSQHR